jgi:hypothetical protein
MTRKKPSREEFDRLVAEREENIRQLPERIARMKAEREAQHRVEEERAGRRRRFFLFR